MTKETVKEVKNILAEHKVLFTSRTKQFTLAASTSEEEFKSELEGIIDFQLSIQNGATFEIKEEEENTAYNVQNIISESVKEDLNNIVIPDEFEKAEQQFQQLPLVPHETLDFIADQMVNLLAWGDLHDVTADNYEFIMEPSAGFGALVDAVLRKHGADAEGMAIVLCEIETVAETLKEKYAELIEANTILIPEFYDFLELQTKEMRGDKEGKTVVPILYFLMAPPTENELYVDHVIHAYKILKPGGTIVALVPYVSKPKTKKQKEFAEFLDNEVSYFRNHPIDFSANKHIQEFKSFYIITIDKD